MVQYAQEKSVEEFIKTGGAGVLALLLVSAVSVYTITKRNSPLVLIILAIVLCSLGIAFEVYSFSITLDASQAMFALVMLFMKIIFWGIAIQRIHRRIYPQPALNR